MLTILAFAAVLFVLVMVHEWGHFFAAKKTGMEVEEFGFGFPPRVASIKKNGTRFSFNLLPIGGFVKIKGENNDNQEPGSFATKSIPRRLIVLAAGVIMNLVLAWVLLSTALAIGAPQAVDGNSAKASNIRVMISDISKNSPAGIAGIKPGDFVVSINGHNVNSVEAVQLETKASAGQETSYVISRDNRILNFKITPRVNPPAGEGAIGVQLAQVADVSYPLNQAIWKGLQQTWDYTALTVSGFAHLIARLFAGESVSGTVTGPVGIAVMTGRFARMGLAALLQFAALLSINLAVINALPIPALDGGRIAFTLIEAVRRKKMHVKVEQWSHAVGFVLLLALMLLVTIRDIISRF